MSSTRLPGKVLKPILGKPMLLHIVERVRKVKGVNDVVIATLHKKTDDVIRKLCKVNRIECFSGSESDVLDRFYRAAKKYHADVVLRITGDCPLVDPNLMNRALTLFLESGQYDHLGVATGAGTANQEFDGSCYPDGLDTEIFSFSTLEAAWREAKDPLEREHVTPFIWKRPERFRVGSYKSDIDYSGMRWTVDNQEDLELIEAIYGNLYPKKPDFGLEDVLDFLQRNPDLLKKNSHFIGSERYENFWK